MTIVWTKGKSAKQIERAIEAATKIRYRVCIRLFGITDVQEDVSHTDATAWMEGLGEKFPGVVWQIDRGNSVMAFGFNGTSYFG